MRSCMTPIVGGRRASRSPPSKGCRQRRQSHAGAGGVDRASTCRSAATARAGQIMTRRRAAREARRSPTDADIDDGDERQHLPLRHLSAHPRRHPRRGQERGADELEHSAAAGSCKVSAAGRRRPRRCVSARPAAGRGADAFKPNAWLTIASRRHGGAHVPSQRDGPGRHTSLTMLLAEELDVDPRKVKVEQAAGPRLHQPLARRHRSPAAAPASAMRWDPLRQAGATARRCWSPPRPRSGRCPPRVPREHGMLVARQQRAALRRARGRRGAPPVPRT